MPSRSRSVPQCLEYDRVDLLDDERFASAGAIRRNRAEVIALLDGILAERTLDEWVVAFEREGVWWAPAQTPAEVVDDPQLIANDGFVELDGGGPGRSMRSVNGPITFSGVAAPSGSRVPALGEHNDEVLNEIAGGS